VIPGAPDTLTWYPEIDATDYNVYSASVTTIVVGMPYGTCLVPNTASLSASIPGDPVTGDALFYLVTGTFFTFEGTAGFDTVDNERLVSGCP
ncbi:MAG: hypothetical protein OEQ13_04820, partial [Acidobacteriota bacterium]|nr:hypothetical protein [Acidobacteriota bacterium]